MGQFSNGSKTTNTEMNFVFFLLCGGWLGVVAGENTIIITSSGSSAVKQRSRMGTYVLDPTKTANSQPVYKQRNGDNYIYSHRYGYWWVGKDITKNSGGIHSQKPTYSNIPTYGWMYYSGGAWKADNSLKFALDNCKSGWTQFGTSCYKVFTEKKSWYDARNSCSAQNADLASITSKAEKTFAWELTGNQTTWIGGSDRETEGTWTWSDGTPWENPLWASGEPNNLNNEDCVILWAKNKIRNTNMFIDERCDKKYYYVCEKCKK